MQSINVTSPSGYLSPGMIHIIQGLEQLGIDVLTDLDIDKQHGTSVTIFPAYTLVKPVRFRQSNDISHGPLFVDVSNCPMSDWGMVTEAMAVRPTIVFNMEDNCTLIDYPPHWIVFSANQSKYAQKGGRQFPFSLGVSADLLSTINSNSLSQRPKNGKILRNFRPSWNQNVRDLLDLALVPQLSRYFDVDRSWGSNQDVYVDKMSSASAVLAYGGQLVFDFFEPSIEENSSGQPLYQEVRKTKFLNFNHFRGPVEVLRWDGYRYYEVCAFGCAPFHLDFEKYGFCLPTPPIAWKEYIPIDLEEVSFLPVRLVNEVKNNPDYFATIGSAARQWLLDNASPASLAKFVLTTIINEGVPLQG